MSTIRLFTASIATADAAAYIEIPKSGKILSVRFSARSTANAGTGAMNYELSFGAQAVSTTNDVRQVIANWTLPTPYVAAAEVSRPLHQQIDLDIAVEAGERIFLHTILIGNAPATAQAWVFLDVDDKLAVPRVRR